MMGCCDDIRRRWEERVPTGCRAGLVILGGILVHVTLGTMYATGNLGVYVISYLRVRAWPPDATNTLVVWVVALAVVGQGLGMLLGGWLTRILGPRASTAIGSLLHSSGWALTAVTVTVSYGAVLATYGLMVGLGIGIAYPGPISAAIAWAPSHRGLLSGLVLAGYGLGAFIFNPIITAFINPWGYSPDILGENSKYFGQADLLDRVPSCFLVLGLTYFCMQSVGCLLICSPPPGVQSVLEVTERSSQPMDDRTPFVKNEITMTSLNDASSNSSVSEAASEVVDKEPLQVLRSPLFYSMWVCFAFSGVSVSLINGLYKAYGLLFISDDHFLAGVGSVASVCNAAGRVLWGLVLDKLSVKKTFCVVSLLLAALTLLLLVQEKFVFAVAVCLTFLSFSGLFVILPVTASLLWGHTHFAINYALLWSSMMVNTLLASLLGQVLQQELGWTWVFCICSMITTLGMVVICFVRGRGVGGKDI